MRSLYIAASGMAAQQTRLETVANNIANVGTTAFKKSQGTFEDLLYQELATVSNPESGVLAELGGGVRLSGLRRDHAQGSFEQSSNPLHLAIEGNGFFAVDGPNGERMYTRDGSFLRGSDGTMVTSGGYRVGGDIVFPEGTNGIRIATDGTVSVQMDGSSEEVVIGELEMVMVDNPNSLRSMGGNLYAATPESGEPRRWEAGTDGRIQQGMLETSNVDVAEELVEMIQAQRAYELNSKVVQTTDEAMQIAANLKR